LTQQDEGAEADEGAQNLMEEREAARAEKDFERADRIRDELAALGWEVRDSVTGPSLVPKV
ncbi:MAG: cysteine--tRNA ligase, partial [Solirubrobacterales bacterium]